MAFTEPVLTKRIPLDPEKRLLKQVAMEDAHVAARLVSSLDVAKARSMRAPNSSSLMAPLLS